MQYIHDFIAEAARKVKVAEAISRTLQSLELIHLAGLTIDGKKNVLDFSRDIESLKGALRLLGMNDEDVSMARAKFNADHA